MLTDAELLLRYLQQHTEAAFAELVRRHLGLVYSAALRRTNGRADLAEEIAQKVFIDLARKAAAVAHHPSLTAWLYRATRYRAIDVAREEARRDRLVQTLGTMTDTPPAGSAPALDWEQLRPVLDAAMDQLKERDRRIVLLRFFNGLSYADIGAQLNLSDNAARMRADRALEQLRGHLHRRGVTSTAVVLGGLLAEHTVAAAPAGLFPAITTTALAAAPTGVVVAIKTFFLMHTTLSPLTSAALAAGVTAAVWFSVTDLVSAGEITALKQENARLTAATAVDAAPAALADVASQYVAQSQAVVAGFAAERARRAASTVPDTSRHRNRGIATPQDAVMTFAWAAHEANVEALTGMMWFDPPARIRAQEIWQTMPVEIQTAYPTPEALYAFFIAADGLIAPPPGADLVAKMNVVEIGPERAAARFPGSDYNNHEFQHTPAGWKYVMPLVGVEHIPSVLQNETLARLAAH